MAEAVGLLMLFGVSLEAACRVEDWVQFRTPFFARERSQQDLLVRDALGMHGRPGGRFQKWSMNSFGMRGPEVRGEKPRNVVRVVTAGASETFGLYESPGLEYPRQLEDSLNARMRELGTSCGTTGAQVLNAAMPGMSLPTVDQDIRLRVSSLHPDFVVLYATPSGYLDDLLPTAARPDTTPGAPARLSAANAVFPRVADRIRVQLKTVLPTFVQDLVRHRQIAANLRRHGPNWRFDAVPAERVTAFEDDLRKAVGTIKAVGAVPVLMTHANRFAGSTRRDPSVLQMWEKFYPRASGNTIVAFDSAARLATMRVARDSQAVIVDLATSLQRSNGAAFADYSHFTNSGAAMVAGSLSDPIVTASSRHSRANCGQSANAERPGGAIPKIGSPL